MTNQEELQRLKEKTSGSSSTMSTPWVSLLIYSVYQNLSFFDCMSVGRFAWRRMFKKNETLLWQFFSCGESWGHEKHDDVVICVTWIPRVICSLVFRFNLGMCLWSCMRHESLFWPSSFREADLSFPLTSTIRIYNFLFWRIFSDWHDDTSWFTSIL